MSHGSTPNETQTRERRTATTNFFLPLPLHFSLPFPVTESRPSLAHSTSEHCTIANECKSPPPPSRVPDPPSCHPRFITEGDRGSDEQTAGDPLAFSKAVKIRTPLDSLVARQTRRAKDLVSRGEGEGRGGSPFSTETTPTTTTTTKQRSHRATRARADGARRGCTRALPAKGVRGQEDEGTRRRGRGRGKRGEERGREGRGGKGRSMSPSSPADCLTRTLALVGRLRRAAPLQELPLKFNTRARKPARYCGRTDGR